MKNNLSDLNNHLFLMLEELEELEDDKMTDKRLEKELKKAQAICSISSQILEVASVQISVIKTAEQCSLLNKEMPALLATKDSANEIAGKKNY